jgi:hypothetical protein
MLKVIEVGLLAVSCLVFLGLIITAPARRRSKTETEEARLAGEAAVRSDRNPR